MTFKANLLPSSDLGYSLGSSDKKWKINGSSLGTAAFKNESGTWAINISGSSASCTGNAATATKISSTPNNTTTFLRGDNTWSNSLLGPLTINSTTSPSAGKSSQLVISNSNNDDTAIEWWRPSGAAFQLVDQSGTLYLKTDYTSSKQSTYNTTLFHIGYYNKIGTFYNGLTIGQSTENTSYKLYVNGTSYLNSSATINGALNCNGAINLQDNSTPLVWKSGSWWQRIFITDDSASGTPVFSFEQSEGTSGSSWKTLATIYDNQRIYATGGFFIDSNNYYSSAYSCTYNSGGNWAEMRCTNGNGSISLLTATNKGVYNTNSGKWLIATTSNNSKLYTDFATFEVPGTIWGNAYNCQVSSTADRRYQCSNSNGTIEVLCSTNRGLYDRSGSKWIAACGPSDSGYAWSNYPFKGAVWNDYAEYRETEEKIEPGRCIREIGDDTLVVTTERLQPGCEIVSDTFGFAIGETDKCKTPTATSGRVLAYPYEDREIFKQNIGKPVCSGPNGTVSIMTDEEYMLKGYCAIGTISAVPDYDIWEAGYKGDVPIKVNGRVWIRVR